jgi:hypothetical protein
MSTVSPDYDVLVDEWALPGLSPASRRKIKSELWKAHATFHQSAYNGPFRFVKPMQQAFTAIAGVLFDAGLLSVEVLEKQLPLFILESAITGNWDVDYFVTDETRTKIFPGYLGHAATWKRFNQSLGNIFEAESSEWKSKLLGAESREDMPKSGSVAPPPVPATKRGRRLGGRVHHRGFGQHRPNNHAHRYLDRCRVLPGH